MDNYPTVKDLREALHDRNCTRIAQLTGIHRESLYRISRGENVNPSAETYVALAQYLFPDGMRR